MIAIGVVIKNEMEWGAPRRKLFLINNLHLLVRLKQLQEEPHHNFLLSKVGTIVTFLLSEYHFSG